MPDRTNSAQVGKARRLQGPRGPMPEQHHLPAAWRRRSSRVDLSLERRAGLLESLERIGQAPPDLEGCGEILDEVVNAVDAEQGVLIRTNPLTTQLDFVIHNQPADRCRSYADHYAELDPSGVRTWLSDAAPDVPAGGARVADLHDLVDHGWLHRTEFYTDFLRPTSIEHALVAVCTSGPRSRAVVCLHRSRECAPFAPEDLAAVELLAPFIGNHMERMVGTTLLTALPENADSGIILCDDRGRILYSNDTARLLCGTGAPAGAVSPLARDAYSSPAFVGQALIDPEKLSMQSESRTVVRQVPLAADRTGLLITIDSPSLRRHRRTDVLHERFGLTERELAVLEAMMGGATNREIATSLFVAECTVKKHMQSISAKVGVRTRTAIAHSVQVALGEGR
jgi:DNA-binding CsgD family transcriptional regulator